MALRALQGPAGGSAPVGGSGTSSPSTIPRWTGPSTLGDSGLIDDGTQISAASRFLSIGTANLRGSRLSVERTGTTDKMATFSNAVDADFEIRSKAAGILTIGPGTGTLAIQTGGAERMRISGTAAQIAIGTSSFTTGRALTTVADLDVFGVRVGRGSGDDANSVAIGAGALASQTAGFRGTVAIGFQACRALQSGQGNIGIGYYALDANQTGQENVAVGTVALGFLSSTSGNVAVGFESGRRIAAGTNMTAATESIFIGRDSRANANSETNQVVIGASAVGNGSNTVTIGNSSNVGTFLDTKYVHLVDSYTVGTLPVAGTAGRIARVTDGDAGLAWGATVVNTGAGATPYLVWDNGTNWTVFGK